MKRVGDGIRDILQQARQMGASDVHLASGRAPLFRVDGRLVNLPGAGPVEPGELDALWAAAAHSSPPAGRRNRSGERDVALELEGVGRIRANVFQSMGARAAVVRLIPPDIPGLDALGLPPSAVELAGHQHGLVLVAGPAGSGKSTTLAAMVQEISRNRDCHVVTLEDPVEYVHPADGRALVRQREVGVDTESFALGLRAALRQDPDVLVVGEMRDVESMHIALVAAETGHLVLSSLHAPSAVQAIDRIVDSFPAEEQSRVRVQLAACLQGVIAQRLLPRREGGRVLASEVLIATHAVRNLVRAGNIYQLQTVMESGRSRGMQTLEQSLRLLRETGTLEEQLGATDPDGGWAAGRLERWAHAGEDIPLPGS